MHGPTLTTQEVVTVLRRHVSRLTSLGIDESAAIRSVALDHGASVGRVTELLGVDTAEHIEPGKS
jgi:hypothetical protein